MDLRQAIILRDKTIAKQQELSSLQIPKVRHSKQELRTGMQGIVQRGEQKRFAERVKKQKSMYDKQRINLDKYISSLQAPQPIGGLGSSVVTSLVPTISFLGLPIQRKIRNIKKRGRI